MKFITTQDLSAVRSDLISEVRLKSSTYKKQTEYTVEVVMGNGNTYILVTDPDKDTALRFRATVINAIVYASKKESILAKIKRGIKNAFSRIRLRN